MGDLTIYKSLTLILSDTAQMYPKAATPQPCRKALQHQQSFVLRTLPSSSHQDNCLSSLIRISVLITARKEIRASAYKPRGEAWKYKMKWSGFSQSEKKKRQLLKYGGWRRFGGVPLLPAINYVRRTGKVGGGIPLSLSSAEMSASGTLCKAYMSQIVKYEPFGMALGLRINAPVVTCGRWRQARRRERDTVGIKTSTGQGYCEVRKDVSGSKVFWIEGTPEGTQVGTIWEVCEEDPPQLKKHANANCRKWEFQNPTASTKQPCWGWGLISSFPSFPQWNPPSLPQVIIWPKGKYAGITHRSKQGQQ